MSDDGDAVAEDETFPEMHTHTHTSQSLLSVELAQALELSDIPHSFFKKQTLI